MIALSLAALGRGFRSATEVQAVRKAVRITATKGVPRILMRCIRCGVRRREYAITLFSTLQDSRGVLSTRFPPIAID